MLQRLRYFFAFLVFLFLIILLVYIFRAPLLTSLANYLIYSEKPQKADAIIILAGDASSKREDYGAVLYKRGYAPKIIVSGGLIGCNVTYAQIMKQYLNSVGVPSWAVLLEGKSTSTQQSALFTLPIVLKNNIKSVIITTSSYHSRRAYNTFKKFFPEKGVKVISCPVEQDWFSPKDWWKRRDDAEMVLQEYFKLIFYRFKEN